ncbi:NAD-dependent epimerase/dehydratase family protein [Streptomyces bathyalis]|uniref:NAD-dependent epimerase/dehydratase family protein n=2 Tax=Streptomyces bathyalis TaxID=2710756 RepID=A0A7T1WVV1_9ACTN|nr:NAD-dependent epimerase/dehydratase family protein [Streptomyces bathyalis]
MLGGTEFVGRAIAEAAAAHGWEVTVFHRGRHAPPPGVRVLLGDRSSEDGLAALAQGEWDAVVDTWSGAPRAVRDTARLLSGRAGRYVYISSRSVYAEPVAAGADETFPVVDASPDDAETDYARAKRGGELAASDAFGDRALLVRAGLIVGPGENVGRLPWWLTRIARGGDVPAPGPPELALQYIDVRDLAGWVVAAARGLGGVYNVVSLPGHTTMGELLRTCVDVTGGHAQLRWRTPESVLASGAEPWTGLPVWLPPGSADYEHMHRSDVSKALAAGLRCRPVEETVADTWAWLRRIGGRAPQRPDRPKKGMDEETEARLLAMPE